MGIIVALLHNRKNKTDMKILKTGTITPPRKLFECPKCQCRFLAEDDDKHLDPRDGDYVICPTCSHTIGWSLGKIHKQKTTKK